MQYLWLIILALPLLAMAAQPLFAEKRGYRYRKKRYLMTRAEADLFRKLQQICGRYYIIVPQVHLSSIFNHKVRGQNWRAAFSHINGKSVDFVLLDAETLEIKCAIECDDYTHNRDERIARDDEVNKIFKNAGVPLVRLRNSLYKNPQQIQKEIKKVLTSNKR